MTEHYSDCAVNNAPALPPGPCDCGLVERLQSALRERDAQISRLREAERTAFETAAKLCDQIATEFWKRREEAKAGRDYAEELHALDRARGAEYCAVAIRSHLPRG